MAKESRVKKTLLNARVNLIFYFLTLVLSFFSRKIFLDCLGASFIGFTGTLQNLLGFLNLAELGVGAAIGYLLYKPLFDDDHIKINEIISVMGYLYRCIGLIILGAGVILSCFLPLIFPYKDTGFHYPLIYFAFYSFLASSLIGYFINYRQNLLAADQKNYVVTAYFQTGNIIKILIQLALAYYTHNLYYWVAIELIFGIIYSVILNWKINKTYPWLSADVRLGKALFKKYPEVMRKSKQVYVHQLTLIGITQTRSIIIYAFTSLGIVAYFMNYSIILDKIFALLRNVVGSITASVGNLIAEKNAGKIQSVYYELYSGVMYVAGIATVCIYALSNDFITLWLGSKYVLYTFTLFPFYVHIYFDMNNDITRSFINGFGLFSDIWAPIAELVIYLVVSILFGWLWGLFGVLCGRLIATLVIWYGWKPYFLFHRGFQISVFKYWKFFIPLFSLQVLFAILSIKCVEYIFYLKEVTIISFISKACLLVLFYSVTSFACFYLLSKGFRDIVYGRFLNKFVHRRR